MEDRAIVKNWTLAFNALHGVKNRDECAMMLSQLFMVPDGSRIEMPGVCFLSGKVSCKDGYEDGNTIMTSFIKSVEKINADDICFTTASNENKYYCSFTDSCPEMRRLLKDVIKGKTKEPGFYLNKVLYDYNFIIKPSWAKYI